MKRKCPWCLQVYDTAAGSAIWCQSNPRRGHKKREPRIVRIGAIALSKSPWAAVLAKAGKETP